VSGAVESGPAPAGFDPGPIREWFAGRADEMAGAVEALASIESPTGDAAALARAREWLETQAEALGLLAESVPGEGGCDHLLIRSDGRPGRPAQLLLGHFDTVWPVGTLEGMPVRAEDGILSGPGVFDMKGGIVQALFAVRASRELGLELPAEPVLFLVSDEETGSRNSKERTIGLAAEASRVFVMEPSFGPDGLLKTARKGIGSFRITIKGVASHAGLDPEAGVSAILEASHQIERIFSLNDPERGITVNVGTIDGGLRPNVVAPEAKAEVEARVFSVADAEEVEGALMGLEPTREGIEIEVEGGFGRSPMERTPGNVSLWEAALSVAAGLGIEIGETRVGGASDGNLTSPLAPTLDGLGAVGGGAHASDEHLVIDRLPERSALLTGLLASPLVEVSG
jgi:glutamate carboxypeptidase